MLSTGDAIEAEAIETSRAQIAQAELIILLLDGSQALGPEQSAILAGYPTAVRAVNKSDLPSAWNTRAVGGLKISAKSGAGLDELKNAIAAHFGCANLEPTEPRWWTERQLEILKRAMRDPKILDAMWTE